MDQTTNYGLNKPLDNETADIAVINGNMDILDGAVKQVKDSAEAAQNDITTHESASDPHTVYIKHALAAAINDFLVASGTGAFVKKTLAEVKAILGLGSAAFTESTAYATAAQGTKADNAIPATEKGAANGVGTLDASGNPVQKPYVTGTYTGDNAYSRTINLNFTPSAVLVLSGGVGLAAGTAVYGGLAITNVPANPLNPSVAIVSNGFNVKHDNSISTAIVDSNQLGNVYTYMVFR